MLDISWNNKAQQGWTKSIGDYLGGATDFQTKALEELQKTIDIIDNSQTIIDSPVISLVKDGLVGAIEIIRNLKAD